MEEKESLSLFFPYYINQGRLLDLYAILNGGYSEYSEITTAVSSEKSKSGKAETSASGGFKLFNLGVTASGSMQAINGLTNENKEKKVQTVTSILSIVTSLLKNKGYIVDIENAKVGQFICLPVVLSINSIKSLLGECAELVKLSGNMQKLGVQVKNAEKKNTDNINNILKTIQILFGGEEILFETEKFAIIGNIVDEHLYQGIRADIIGSNLTCFAQVKRIFPNGTQLMKNTIFTKIKDVSAKEKLIDGFKELVDGDAFEFEAVAVSSIKDKPVYQIEIIALYQ